MPDNVLVSLFILLARACFVNSMDGSSKKKKYIYIYIYIYIKDFGVIFLHFKTRVNFTYFVFWETFNHFLLPLKGDNKLRIK